MRNSANNTIKAQGKDMTVLELTVNNHPGVMSHICNLFSRRAYNVEGIVCIPIGKGETSRMWLQVNEEVKLEQIIKQVKKQEDVLEVERHDSGHEVFLRLASVV
ncbi:acetolactate synthase small subunit [Desulforhopalus singaporensis]|uniref:acetolactate synthase n=1 Tax=Desulforhopalus singaporensis TaxID=91360 RepID=A0A1H0TSH5_9BACT|nr:acetolactate synthase small subunit [Desulforhopalus singaporensis]SDP56710.1 acetolactate synthase, small subunit [Desulforhopalus singaporensis]